MKKSISLLLGVFMLFGCKSMMYNYALKKMGVYDDGIQLKKIIADGKEVVFFPMHHLGTVPFYNDVRYKIDSLKKQDFYFYVEGVKGSENDTILRKWRKLHGELSPGEEGFKEKLDSILGIKFKKELIVQPEYKFFGIDTTNAKRTDVSLDDLVNYYETKYGEVKLEECDFETDVFKKSTCEDKAIMSKEIIKDVRGDFRNTIVINELLNDNKHDRIAIIYGKGHVQKIIDTLKVKTKVVDDIALE